MVPRWRWLPRPFEWFTAAMVAAIVLYLRLRGLRIDSRTVEYMAVPMLDRLPLVLALGISLQVASHLLSRRSVVDWIRAVATPASALLWLRVWLAAMAMTYGYSWLKISIPLLTTRLLDGPLWDLDRALHLGLSPSVLAVELVAGTPAAGWIDLWYGFWVDSVLLALAWVFLAANAAHRRHFAFACAFFWLVGAWIYYAFPALGPCFVSPDVFAGIASDLPHARGTQLALWDNYLHVVAGRDGTLKQFKPFLAIAAMPSLHVGAHWLFALWARRHAPRLFLPFAVATALTFFGSLVTGWHYAVDGYAGMLLAWLAVRVADRAERVAPAALSALPASGDDGVGQQQAGDERDRDQDHAERGLDAEHDVALEQRGEAAIADRARHEQQDRGHQRNGLGKAGAAGVEPAGEADRQRADEHAELGRDQLGADPAALEAEEPDPHHPR